MPYHLATPQYGFNKLFKNKPKIINGVSNGIRSADSQSGFDTLLSRLVLKYLPLATIFSASFESGTLVYIINTIYNIHPKIINGVSNGIRTHDLQSHNLTLYQLRYTHHKLSPYLWHTLIWLRYKNSLPQLTIKVWYVRRDSNPRPSP